MPMVLGTDGGPVLLYFGPISWGWVGIFPEQPLLLTGEEQKQSVCPALCEPFYYEIHTHCILVSPPMHASLSLFLSMPVPCCHYYSVMHLYPLFHSKDLQPSTPKGCSVIASQTSNVFFPFTHIDRFRLNEQQYRHLGTELFWS
jgi:hypothetical protein